MGELSSSRSISTMAKQAVVGKIGGTGRQGGTCFIWLLGNCR